MQTPEIVVNEDGTKSEVVIKPNRHMRRARMAILRKEIRKAKKNGQFKTDKGSTGSTE